MCTNKKYKGSPAIINKAAALFLCLFVFITAPAQAIEPTLLQKAVDEQQQKHYTKSNYYYFKFLSTQNESAEVRYGLAYNFHHLRQNARALGEVNTLLQLDPDHEQGLILRALLNTQSENWNSVLTDTDRVIQLNPNNAHAYLYRDFAYTGLDNKEAAQAALEQYKQLTADAPQ